MSNIDAPRTLISDIAEEIGPHICAILLALEDGEALANLGVTDEDQDTVEAAHALAAEWIKKGFVTLDQTA